MGPGRGSGPRSRGRGTPGQEARGGTDRVRPGPPPHPGKPSGIGSSPPSRSGSPGRPVCRGHTPPWEYFSKLIEDRPSLALVLGPRGGGKSFLSALDTHLTSRWNPRSRDADPGREPGAVGAGLPGPPRGRLRRAGAGGSDAASDRQAAEGRGDLPQRVGGGDPRGVEHERPRAARPEPEARRGRRDRRRAAARRRWGCAWTGTASIGLGGHDVDLAPGRRPDGRT